MKKGISLIVLVITIIVMIIIAGAIILSLNSSNVTGKANWAQVSADRANLQSEFATILADVVANEDLEEDYVGVTIDDLKDSDDTKDTPYEAWVKKVTLTNGDFSVSEPTDKSNPSGIKVVMTPSVSEAKAFGLKVRDTETGLGSVYGYDWVTVVADPTN